jgi:hypothetical protein
MGVNAEGKKELLAMHDGYRESADSWNELLFDLKQLGLTVDPKWAMARWDFGELYRRFLHDSDATLPGA